MTKRENLKKLKFFFEIADKTYKSYIKNDSIYLYALILRKYNLEMRELLLELIPYLPEEFFQDSINLCHHFDVWLALFDDLEKLISPNYKDRFIFENTVSFPIDFVNELRSFNFNN